MRNPNEDITNPKNGWLSKENEETLQRLVRVIDFAEGFTLLFAQCNVPNEQLQLLAELRHRLLQRNIVATDVIFDKPIQNIREHIQKLAPQIVAQPVFRPGLQPQIPTTEPLLVAEPTPAYHAKQRDVIFVLGLAHSIDYKASASRLLAELNLGRDAFRYQFPCAMLFWLPDYALTAVARQSPDFWAWRSGVFEFASQPELRDEALQHLTHGEGSTPLEVSNAEVQEKLQRRLHLINLLDEYERLPVTSATQSERAGLLIDLAVVESYLGNLERAIEHYQDGLPLLQLVGDVVGEASVLTNLGTIAYMSGQNELALNYYNKALPLLKLIGDQSREVCVLNNIGLAYSALGENRVALKHFLGALELLREINDHTNEAMTLNNIGLAYSSLGEKLRALTFYEEALILWRTTDDHRGLASTLRNIGNIYVFLRQSWQALNYYNEAISLFRKIGDYAGEANVLSAIGSIYSEIGEKQTALEFFEKALQILRETSDRHGESLTLTEIGNMYFYLGDSPRAIEYYESALLLHRTTGNISGEAGTLNNIGLVYTELGDLARAIEYYGKALPLLQMVDNMWGECATRFNLALIYEKNGDLKSAEDELAHLVAIEEKLHHPDLENDRSTLDQIRRKRAEAAITASNQTVT